jgi:elongation factor P
MIDFGDLKRGVCLQYKGSAVVVTDVSFSNPTARGASMIGKTKMRNLLTGQVLSDSFRSGDKFEEVDVERHPCSFLYSDGSRWHFMDDTSYEQFDLGPKELGDSTGFLVEGIEDMEVMFVDGALAGVELPNTVDLEITDTTPPIKGATASAQLKSATLETGVEVQVPPYLVTGERVRIDTRDSHYVERVKQ